MTPVVTVLRSGGDFAPWHVQMMKRQVERWAPKGTEFWCLSDRRVDGVDTIPLLYDWPGWWAKIELLDPRLGLDSFIYTDLDNVIMGPLDDILATPDSCIMQAGGWNALMRVPSVKREPKLQAVYDRFCSAPGFYMGKYDPALHDEPFGDAGFMDEYIGRDGSWEQLLPGQVTNIATALTPLGPRRHLVAPTTRVLLFGGKHRRPWNLPGFRQLYGEDL